MGGARFPPIKFAYEALVWGTYINTWEASWDIVQHVNLPNFGLVIDTANITGMVYADPSAAGGRNGPQAEANMRQSLHRLATRVNLEKLFVVQMADAEKLSESLKRGHPFYMPGQPFGWVGLAQLDCSSVRRTVAAISQY